MCSESSSNEDPIKLKYARIWCLHCVVFLIYAVVAGILVVTLGVMAGQASNKMSSYSSLEWRFSNDNGTNEIKDGNPEEYQTTHNETGQLNQTDTTHDWPGSEANCTNENYLPEDYKHSKNDTGQGNQTDMLEWRSLEITTNEVMKCNGDISCMDSSVAEDVTQINMCNDWEFHCANGECIDDWQKCNGKRNCQDGSDEVLSVCRNTTCKGYQYRCAYGGCTDKKNICDGIPDCQDSSDENNPSCNFGDDGMFECKSGRLIEIWRVCDGQAQCPDGSDEMGSLCGNISCHSGQFRCAYGACLFVGSPCNGIAECTDKSDETPELCKDIRCNDDQFRCAYGVCIDSNYVCDGIRHCVDGSDEDRSTCVSLPCNATDFQCSYGACIPMSSACDGQIDCADGSDEILTTCQQNKCKKEQFRCTYGACISRTDLCDGESQCSDGSDETAPQCQYVTDGLYTCEDGTWTQGFRICDGVGDCPDKSDEMANLCEVTVCHDAQTRCAYGACHMNATNCDGVKDCLDGHDESYEVCATVRCFLPAHPAHGRYTVSTADVVPGDSVETVALSISCDEGYTVDSDEAVFCNNGRWSVETFPKCVRFCTLPNDPSVGFKCLDPGTDSEQSRPCRERELAGAVALPSCNGPNFYATHALPHMTCVNGTWDKIANCTTECGRVTPSGKTTIAGGRDAEFGELPWHAAIYRKGTPYEQICGGSLVSENVVVSAAHCFWEYNILEKKYLKQPAKNYAVAMGKLYRRWADRRDLEAQRSDVSEILLSPLYEGQAKNQQADIAVLIVSRAFEYRPHIRPVCLSFDLEFDEAQLMDGHKGKVAGWGRAGRNARESPQLKVVELPFIPIGECDARMPQDFKEYLTFDKFCAGFWQGGIAVCKGDSGGGLAFPETYNGIDRYFLRGIVSTAPKNDDLCNVDIYTTMTHVLQHQQLITQHL